MYWFASADHRGGYAYRLCKVIILNVDIFEENLQHASYEIKQRYLYMVLLVLLKAVSMKVIWTFMVTFHGFTITLDMILIPSYGHQSLR